MRKRTGATKTLLACGAIAGPLFVWCSSLSPRQVMDNLPTPRCEEVDELIEARGCELFFVSPCSPDYDPIEEAFSKIKALLRKAEARTRDALIEVLWERRSQR